MHVCMCACVQASTRRCVLVMCMHVCGQASTHAGGHLHAHACVRAGEQAQVAIFDASNVTVERRAALRERVNAQVT